MSNNRVEDELIRLRNEIEELPIMSREDNDPVVVQMCSIDKLPLLGIEEASLYFGIGIKKLYQIIKNVNNLEHIALKVGNKVLIKRERFERYIMREDEI